MRALLEFFRRYNYVLFFVLLEVIGVVLVTRSSYHQGATIVSWGNAIAGQWYQGTTSLTEYFGLRTENDRLAAENAMLRAQQASSYISYSDSVFMVNDTVYKQQYSYVDAKVIRASWTQHNNYIMIDKGADQGVHPDQAVISPLGIVGVVVNTTHHFSTIMPVLHPHSNQSVKIRRTDLTGTLIWEGGDYRYSSVIDIPTTHKLYKNDTIITSGYANEFPEGILVGFVESFTHEEGSGFYHIKVRLATDFVNMDHVYVIDNHFKQEQDELMRQTEESIQE